jgi:hypothetical protein
MKAESHIELQTGIWSVLLVVVNGLGQAVKE